MDDVIDPQSSVVAKAFFSEKVETVMSINGDTKAAKCCRVFRNWYSALDERGVTCLERINRLFTMREWLLSFLIPKLCEFPPPGGYVASIPITNFEGILLSTERVVQLYTEAKGGTFNCRSLGSQISETYFASFRDLDPQSVGVLRPDDLPRAISTSCKILEARLDPDR